MKFAVLRLTFCALAVVLAGCSSMTLETKKIDYKSASSTKVPTLEIPPDLTSPARDDRFAVPDSVGKGSATVWTCDLTKQYVAINGDYRS